MKKNTKRIVRIFHIERKNGEALFLHPFKFNVNFMDYLENCVIEGLYGKEPRIESITHFRNTLYRAIEKSVRDWLADLRFLPKFIASAALFLGVYFFMSFVVRDPLPLVDELLIAIAASVGLFIYLERRDIKSDRAISKRVKLRTAVDTIVFAESSFIHNLEELLHTSEQEDTNQQLRNLFDSEELILSDTDKELAEELLQALKVHFNSKDLAKNEKIIQQYKKNRDSEKAILQMGKGLKMKNFDYPLFSLYARIKEKLSAGSK